MEDQNTQQNPEDQTQDPTNDSTQDTASDDGVVVVVMDESYGTTDDSGDTSGTQTDGGN